MYRQAWSSTPYTVTYVSVPFGCSQMVSFIINWHTSVKGSPETKQNFKYQNKKKIMGTPNIWPDGYLTLVVRVGGVHF